MSILSSSLTAGSAISKIAIGSHKPADSKPIVRTQDWGALTERRVRIASGLEIEFGFASPSWAATDPIDPGTVKVVRRGCTLILDESALFERLIDAV